MNKEGHIDLERISSSIETLTSIENIVNLVDLSDNFEDIEKCFRQVNFEHANCLNYKESLELIYADLEIIKRKINELAEALRKTKLNYTKINSFTDGDIKEFTEIYKTTPASEDLSKLVGTDVRVNLSSLTMDLNGQNSGNVTTIPTPDTTPQEQEPINTVPIGIAIGATGVAGSIGAVIVDDIYTRRDKKSKKVSKDDVYIEDYDEDNIVEEKYDYDRIRKSSGIAQGPYRAARLEREADRFYGSELQKLNLENNDDEEYLDEDDDDYDYDDF